MTFATIRYCFVMVVWAAALLGALLISHLPGNWGHGICGPWGCGPPLQSLVACHLAWLVVFGPAAFLVARSTRLHPRIVKLIGIGFMLVGCLGVLAIVIHQGLVWWPHASQWQRNFFWQRCLFVLATAVDVPVTQLFFASAVLLLTARRRSATLFHSHIPHDRTVATNG